MFRDYVCRSDSPDSVYVVQPGDSLWRIASQRLNDSSRWREIASYNMLQEPYTIFVGQRLYLPSTHTSTTNASATNGFPATFVTPAAPQTCSVSDPTSSIGPISTPGSEKQPAVFVERPTATFKFTDDVTVLLLKFPGGTTAEFGFKGEFVMKRKSHINASATRDGPTVELVSSEKDSAASEFMKVVNKLGVKISKTGAVTVYVKAGIQTDLFEANATYSEDGGFKYEVKPQPVKVEFDDVTLQGNIGCWIKVKFKFEFDTDLVPETIPVLTPEQIRNLVMISMTLAAVQVAGSNAGRMAFAELVKRIANGMAGTASRFMMILVPAELLEQFRRENGLPPKQQPFT